MNTQIEQVKNEIMPIPDQARMIMVRDQETLSRANDFFLTIKELRKKIDQTFSPIISAAHKAHQEAILQRKIIEEPLIVAEKYLNGQVTAYHEEVEWKRREEEERLRQEAIKIEMERRKKEEDDRLAQAAALDEIGAHEEAQAIIDETIEENSKPVEIFTPPPETPKVKLEGAMIKEYWRAEVIDLRALCRAIGEGKCSANYVSPNMAALNDRARADRGELRIPGVKAIPFTSMAATGKRANRG